MKFKKFNKCFGIHSDRVRHTGLKHIKDKYNIDSNQYKDY